MTLGDKPKLSLSERIYKIKKHRKGRESIVEGTLEYLTQYFSYTLEVGHSYNPKIDRHPKTIKSLMTNLRKSLDIKEGACYERTYLELVYKDESGRNTILRADKKRSERRARWKKEGKCIMCGGKQQTHSHLCKKCEDEDYYPDPI
jgi:hypothetical protein